MQALEGEGLAEAAARIGVDTPTTYTSPTPPRPSSSEAGYRAIRRVHGQKEAGRVEPRLLEPLGQIGGIQLPCSGVVRKRLAVDLQPRRLVLPGTNARTVIPSGQTGSGSSALVRRRKYSSWGYLQTQSPRVHRCRGAVHAPRRGAVHRRGRAACVVTQYPCPVVWLGGDDQLGRAVRDKAPYPIRFQALWRPVTSIVPGSPSYCEDVHVAWVLAVEVAMRSDSGFTPSPAARRERVP